MHTDGEEVGHSPSVHTYESILSTDQDSCDVWYAGDSLKERAGIAGCGIHEGLDAMRHLIRGKKIPRIVEAAGHNSEEN